MSRRATTSCTSSKGRCRRATLSPAYSSSPWVGSIPTVLAFGIRASSTRTRTTAWAYIRRLSPPAVSSRRGPPPHRLALGKGENHHARDRNRFCRGGVGCCVRVSAGVGPVHQHAGRLQG